MKSFQYSSEETDAFSTNKQEEKNQEFSFLPGIVAGNDKDFQLSNKVAPGGILKHYAQDQIIAFNKA